MSDPELQAYADRLFREVRSIAGEDIRARGVAVIRTYFDTILKADKADTPIPGERPATVLLTDACGYHFKSYKYGRVDSVTQQACKREPGHIGPHSA